jgi:hypothetical protein
MLYLLLSFPLGLIYFIILITGFSVGIPLIIIWIGLIILAGMFALWIGFIIFERKMAIWLLKVEIALINLQDNRGRTLWQKFKAKAGNPVTWKGLAFLMAKFPIGVINFCILVSFLSLSLALLTVPLYYNQFKTVIDLSWSTTPMNIHIINTFSEALLVSLIGLFTLVVSMHIFNGMAILNGKFARLMLGNNKALIYDMPAPSDESIDDPVPTS